MSANADIDAEKIDFLGHILLQTCTCHLETYSLSFWLVRKETSCAFKRDAPLKRSDAIQADLEQQKSVNFYQRKSGKWKKTYCQHCQDYH